MTRVRTAAVRTAALLFLLACCSAALAQTTFTQQSYKTNDGASMAVADLNGDGKPDIVVNHEFGNTVDVYLNQGTGTFTDLGSASYVTGAQPLQVVIGDFNGDGKPDIATNNCAGTQTPQGTVSFLYGNGDGSFQTHADSAPNGNANCPSSIAVMKSTGGDRLAVATTGPSPSIVILSAKSATTISTVSTIPLPAGVVTAQLTSGDYNHDGTADLAVLETDNLGNGSLVLYLSSASGLAPKSVALSLPAGMSAQGIHTVQANNDGVDDLALSLAGNNTAAAQILVNDGTASIWTQRTLTVPGTFEGATGIASADFNGDGINDMLVLAKATETGTDAYAIFPGINGNSWGSPQVIGSGTRIVWQDAAAADFNADQKADFAALSTSDAMIHVFTNQTSPRGNCAVPTTTGISICAPVSGSTVASPVQISAAAKSVGHTITAMKAYIDNKLVLSSTSNAISGTSAQANGAHTLIVNAWNEAGTVQQATVKFNVGTTGTTCGAPTTAGVALCSPNTGTTNQSPFTISAAANGGGKPITAMKAYIDGVQVASSTSATLTATASASAGTHTINVNAWNTAGQVFTFAGHFSVGGTPPPTCTAPSTAGETVCSPAAGATVSSPVQIAAAANGGGKTVTAMKAYVDGVQVAASTSGTLNASVNVAVGTHTLDVNSWTSGVLLATHRSTFTVH